MEHHRRAILQQLSETPFIDHGGPNFWHGRLMSKTALLPPNITWKSRHKPRSDHGSDAPWLSATEYCDSETGTRLKLKHLTCLLKFSQKTVVYSGAGISVSAGIGQAARGSAPAKNKTTTAMPTPAHCAIVKLYKAGLIHSWVQQNHDGLPQKAGFPQECVNEVHGSWYDPSNPVVVYSGDLKQRECNWMEEEAQTADLVLVIGTTLGGLNADQVALEPALRSLRKKSLGMVIINLQQTEHDGKASLRLFGAADDLLVKLVCEMVPNNSAIPTSPPNIIATSRCVLVPYNAEGKRRVSKGASKMWWDLRPGAKIQLTESHNIYGAGQPEYEYMIKRGESKRTKTKKQKNLFHDSLVKRKAKHPPTGVVRSWNTPTLGIVLQIEQSSMLLGQWWLEAAERGALEELPVVNCKPEFEN